MRRCTSPRVAAIVRAIKIISREELAQRLANQTKGASSKGSTVGTWIQLSLQGAWPWRLSSEYSVPRCGVESEFRRHFS
jgi:hypothetical protein